MRPNVPRLTVLGILLLSACAGDSDSLPGETRTSSGALMVRGNGAPLTAPSRAPAARIAAGFVQARGSAADVHATGESAGRGGITHVRLEQRAGALRVHGAYARVAVSPDGEVLQLIDHLAPAGAPPRPAQIGAREALAAALTALGRPVDLGGVERVQGNLTQLAARGDFHRSPSVELVAYLAADGLRQGYLVETWTGRDNLLDHTLVGGDGAVVSTERRTNHDSYHVFVEDPSKGSQTTVAGPGAGNAQSPSGWLAGAQTTINITGNNAHAYLDADANNSPDAGGTAVTTGVFSAVADLSAQPSTAGNRAVAVQNLFFLNNTVHDLLYRHGFNEAAGNFQTSNFGLGGNGNDPVQAEAQDGSGTDNANFATPNDGSAPRMQMYLWSSTTAAGLAVAGGASYGLFGSSFGAALNTTGVSGALALYADATGTPSDACELSTTALTGKIALIDRGTCDFTVKVLNAQKAGALGVIIANNAPDGAFSPGGTDRKVKIPSGMVSQADGAALRGQAGTATSLRLNPVTPVMVDGDVDADVVFHEYGHGLTWRMIGSMSGALAGALGEGASDVTAFLRNGDDRVGEYSAGNALGIRRFPYQDYPLTYRAVTGASVHNDGEIYAGAMWRVLQNYLAAGLTADDLMGDFVDAMNFTPAAPAYEDMRDGMLQSVAGSGRECLIWRGFAASGIGVGADGRVSNRGAVTITESFALPPGC